MYSEDTQEILQRMKNNVPNDLSKEEGSIIHDTLTGVAEELGFSYYNLNEVLNRVFIKRALENGYSEEVELRCAELGIFRKQGIKAYGIVTFYGEVGTVINQDIRIQTKTGLKYRTLKTDTISTLGLVRVPVEAEQIGILYNCAENTIVELESQIAGVISLTNELAFNNGVDIETDQKLYERYNLKITTPITSGNESHYKQWALEVPGVGDAKIISTWNGPGTVKVIILSDKKRTPSQDVIDSTSQHIELNRPVGATITVVGADEFYIDVSATIQLTSNMNDVDEVRELFVEGLNRYLDSIAFKGEVVRYTRIANIFLDIPYIVDYFDLKVNEGTSNIEVSSNSVAVLGTVNINVN